MQRHALILSAALFSASSAFAVPVTNVIDAFTTEQFISTNNGSVSETIVAASIGGYRTLELNAPGASGFPTFLSVGDTPQQLGLDTPLGITSSYQVTWGGAGGTSGLGGFDFGAGQPLDLLTSVLSFSLAFADQSSNFSWSFTDTASNTATYNGIFPAHSATDPALPVTISLDDFSNAAGVNWNAIDFIVLSGGGTASLDIALGAPIELVASTVPEPGTWALFATGLALTTLVLRRQARRNR